MPETQVVMTVSTPLEDVLLFHGMHAREELGRLFEFKVSFLSEKPDVDATSVLGKPVTVHLSRDEEGVRHFNGYVSRFSAGGRYGRYYRYQAEVVPWLWFLTRTADCRIFQDKTVPDILRAVFDDHKTTEVEFSLTGSYRKWNYCVQYRETDFNFVSRLMEQEGIYYFFKHDDGKHTMVVTDSTAKHEVMGGLDALRFIPPGDQVLRAEEHVSSWEVSKEVQPGVYVHDDYDLERPSVELKVRKQTMLKYTPNDHEVYDYPGAYLQTGDGDQYAGVRIDEFGTQFERCRGVTNSRGVCVGALLKLQEHPRDDQNREYLVLSSTYDLEYSNYEGLAESEGAQVGCSFIAMPTSQQFRTRRLTPKPFVQGPQTAVVVGPGGEEIYTDKFGRVKVQFHWDRRGTKDENSSCWIRVSHPWAGKGWGSVATPRIGQEVIVDFLEGDPDRPIVTGRVYNAENQPPFGFPAGAVISGVKSDTHKGGGYNEISLDDTAGNEKITVHGQYDMNSVIEHDQTLTVHNCRTDRIDVDDSESVGNNQKWDVGVNRDATIGSNETLSVGADRTKTVGANETIDIGADRDATVGASETLTVALQRTHTVGVNETISVGAAQEITVGAAQIISVGAVQAITVGKNQSTDVGGNQSTNVAKDLSTTVGANESRQVKGQRGTVVDKDDNLKVGKNYVLDAGDSITLKTGSASITMKKDGTIFIKGKDITIEGSGKINAKASKDIVMKGSKILQN